MSTSDSPRSVRIGSDERTGWSSDRPRRDGAPPRPVDISVKSRLLAPSDRLRYSPGSLVVIVGPAAAQPAAVAERVVEERGAVLSAAKVRTLLEGRVPEDQMDAKAVELLDAAVQRRIQANQSVVVASENLDSAERERYARMAHGLRRPRHLIMLEAPRESVTDTERGPLDDLRRALEAGEVGLQGFQTALRLGGAALSELKRIVFQPPPRED